ncbi:uncharacterized protein LOC120261415 isoform X2 [Dioscorea cayenensis subsp. rotundata]|uniref:Uncharacterized protein LOC120261415 isoform X2 n=1 Tax=Dioscorea cayennensis subsp. rotundata TaxID=55577 RepID=A0AB40BF19_DIOCR|nr:uncharacterized protein LOC120261415 isoform X2 [Dioscorea cayenensis subsp. rotundata]
MGAFDTISGGGLSYSQDRLPAWAIAVDGASAPIGNLSDQFLALDVGGSSKDHLIQVMKAVEDAEAMIGLQVEENKQLKDELMRKEKELEQYKLVSTSVKLPSNIPIDEHDVGRYKVHQSTSVIGNESDGFRWAGNGSLADPYGALNFCQTGAQASEAPSLPPSSGDILYSERINVDGTLKSFSGLRTGSENSNLSQLAGSSSRSFSPNRHQGEGEYDSRITLPGHRLLPVSDVNSNVLLKQVREREEEILQLRKHLAAYSVKEEQIRGEKCVLEKRIAYMRAAFDRQQQDLVEAASKSLSYRQDIMEENVRLSYALQAAQDERRTFVSSLMPLLEEYSLQPSIIDAQSIVSSLKILFKHLQERLFTTEEKLRESQYQVAPWHPEISNNTSFPPQSPSHLPATPRAPLSKNALEIVPQAPYSHGQSPVSSPSNLQTRVDWETLANQSHHAAPSRVAMNNLDRENLDRSTPTVSRTSMTQDTSTGVNQGVVHHSAESQNQTPSFKEFTPGNVVDDSDAVAFPHGRETSGYWGSGNIPAPDDGNSSYPYLPPVLEEPGSSFSEAAEDEPLPGIDGLQIAGDPFPGRELQACGYSINGTTSCNFEWVRYLENGAPNYIEGAKQPKYLVTADDVDTVLAIEVQPLDNRKRKGELVMVLANDGRRITCDAEMKDQVERAYRAFHASFEVLISAGALDIWEPATLAIKRDAYSIKRNGPRGVVVEEKFQPAVAITIPFGQANEFAISSPGGEYLLKAVETGVSRDTIVLTMRMLKMRAVEKRKGRKRGLFFK